MVDQEDNAWFIEANSAPSLPYNSDGSHTYRQKCLAKALAYTLTTNKEMLSVEEQLSGFKRFIHPSIWNGLPVSD